uniref:ZAD domain-containing protein n=1 Tax=Anopheles dirus TaxID=7168 RepID=A0A182NSW9_9DIPT
MSSSASSSTAGNSGAGAAGANQASQGASATDGGGHGSNSNGPGAEGNVVEKQQSGAGGGGGGGGAVGHVGSEPHTSSPAHHRAGGAGGAVGGGGGGTTGTVLRRKTNVCLICGIYTNLSLNIFEPRNGPNIVDVIYEKYKFRAERGDNADKHICFSCNNWLINWYSLQNTSSGNSRAYEPAPSTSRSSSLAADSSNNSRHPSRHHAHKPRTKPNSRHSNISAAAAASSDKENRPTSENADQHELVSSTTNGPGDQHKYPARQISSHRSEVSHPYAKKTATVRRCFALKENNGQREERPSFGSNPRQKQKRSRQLEKVNDADVVVSSSTEQTHPDPYKILVKPFESRLIRMLEGQGTSVTKESGSLGDTRRPWVPRTAGYLAARIPNATRRAVHDTTGNVVEQREADCGTEIVISFDSALSEVIDVVPSLKAIQWETARCRSEMAAADPVRSLRQRLSSGALTVSVIDDDGIRSISGE